MLLRLWLRPLGAYLMVLKIHDPISGQRLIERVTFKVVSL